MSRRGLAILAILLVCAITPFALAGFGGAGSGGLASGMFRALSNFGLDGDERIRIARDRMPSTEQFEKFGENPDVDTATFETITDIGGVYAVPTQARVHAIVSNNAVDAGTVVSSGTTTAGNTSTTLVDSAATFSTDGVAAGDAVLNDTACAIGFVTGVTSETQLAIAGVLRSPTSGRNVTPADSGEAYRVVTDASTGAAIFYVQGLNVSRLMEQEFVVLNGVTPVNTTGSYTRQFRARAFGENTSVVGNGAVGTLSSTAATDGTISCQIIDGNNQTLMAVYTIPVDKTGYVFDYWAAISKAVANASSTVRLRVGQIDGYGYITQTRTLQSNGNSDFHHTFGVPLELVGGVDVWVEANASANDVGISAGFGIMLVDN